MAGRRGLEIRGALPADAPWLAELLARAGHVVDPRVLAPRLEALRAQPGTALIAADWGPPAGLVVLHWFTELTRPAPTARITALFVAPEERRRGIGRLLVKAAAQAARVAGCGGLELAVPDGGAELAGFALATGFVAAGADCVRQLRKRGGE